MPAPAIGRGGYQVEKIMYRTFLIGLVVFLAAACGSTQQPANVDSRPDFPVFFLDDGAAEAVSFPNYRAERLPSGHISVSFACLSRYKKKPTVIDWKVIFLDSRQMPMDQTEWHTEYLQPREVKMLQASSIRTDSTAFRVQIRTPYGVKGKQQ